MGRPKKAVTETKPETKDVKVEVEVEKKPYTKEWTDYVLGLMDKDEIVDGCPTIDGLRKAAAILGLNVVKLNTDVIIADRDFAVVKVRLVQTNGSELEGVAEVNSNNSDPPYSQYPVATAATRAEARALRHYLKLRKVVSAEERSRKADISIPMNLASNVEGSISETQINFIEVMCKNNLGGISVKGVVQHLFPTKQSIKEVSYEESMQLQKQLQDWVKDKASIPDVGKFDANWKAEFC